MIKLTDTSFPRLLNKFQYRFNVQIDEYENKSINGSGQAIGSPDWRCKGGEIITFMAPAEDVIGWNEEMEARYYNYVQALITSWSNENFKYAINTHSGSWYTYESRNRIDITTDIAEAVAEKPLDVERLMYKAEYLTEAEKDIVAAYNPEFAKENLHYLDWDNRYLNLYLYSEAEHHERQFRMETGM